jgi:hypothetical protein
MIPDSALLLRWAEDNIAVVRPLLDAFDPGDLEELSRALGQRADDAAEPTVAARGSRTATAEGW